MVRNFILRFGLDALSRILFFGINILVARKMAVSDYGVFVYALSVANMLYVFTDLGMSQYLLKEVGGAKNRLEGAWHDSMALRFLLSAVVLVGASLFMRPLWPWGGPAMLLAAIGWMIGNSFSDYYQAICNALHDLRLAAKLLVSSRSILVIAAIALFISGKVTLRGVLTVYCLGSLVGAMLAGYMMKRQLQLGVRLPGFDSVRDLFAKIIPLGIANLFLFLYLRFDTVLMAMIRGAEETGFYGASYKVFEMAYAVPYALMMVSTPLLARAREDGGGNMKRIAGRVMSLSILLAIAWLVTGYFGARVIIELLFGSRYASSIPSLKILVVANAVAFLAYAANGLLIALGEHKKLAYNQAITMAVSLIANLALITRWGGQGAATAVLLTQCCMLVVCGLSIRESFRKHEESNRNVIPVKGTVETTNNER